MKGTRTINFAIRVGVAVVLGVCIIGLAAEAGPLGPAYAAFYGLVLFLLFGIPFVRRMGERASQVFIPDDSEMRIVPEYSLAEARVKVGKYAEAVDEYRKVIAAYPEGVYPHLRIADLAIAHLNDFAMAESELLLAVAMANGEETAAIVAGRLADFYQFTLQQPQRALEVMEQLRAKFPGTKRATLAEERIATLRGLAAGGEGPKRPATIAHKTADEETIRRRRGF